MRVFSNEMQLIFRKIRLSCRPALQLVLVCCLWGCAFLPEATAQTLTDEQLDDLVGDIRMEAYRLRQAEVHMERKQLQILEGQMFGPAMLVGYADERGRIRKLEYINRAGLPDTVAHFTYVFDDIGQVIYVQEEIKQFAPNADGQPRPTGESTSAYFYFDDNALIRWLNHDRQRVDILENDYQERGDILMLMGLDLRETLKKQ